MQPGPRTSTPRHSHRIWLLVLLAAAVLAYGSSLYRNTNAAAWPADFEAASAAAAEQGKPLLIQFKTEYCPYCRRMQREVLSDPALAPALEAFELVQVDANERDDLARQYWIESVPTFVITDPAGTMLARLEGVHDVDGFQEFVNRSRGSTSAGP